MEGKFTSHCDVSWFLRVSRLTVAVSIIKSRPSEGVRHLTESLSRALKQKDDGWKCKARDLQEDVLRLKQDLILTRSLLKAQRCAGPPDGHEDLCHVDTQQLKCVSGCDAHTSSHSSEDLPLTPPNSQNVVDQESGLVKHMQFLQCLSSLQRDHGPALCVDDDVLWDSVVQLLDCVLDVFRRAHVGRPVHHPELLRYTAQVMSRTLSGGKTHPWPSLQRFSRVEDLLKEMICLLLTGYKVNVFSVKGLMSECLMILGGSRVVREALIKLLMSHVFQMAQHLWNICQSCTDHHMDWICYENSFYVFWLLEQLSGFPHDDVNQEFIKQLETQAFSLSDEFPLFSLYMWRIGGLYRTTAVRLDETERCCHTEPV